MQFRAWSVALVAVLAVAGVAAQSEIVVADGCTQTGVTGPMLSKGFFDVFVPRTPVRSYTFTRATANNGLAPTSDAACAALASPCTIAYEVSRYQDDAITMKPKTNAYVGPEGECTATLCQGAVGALNPATDLITGDFYNRGSTGKTYAFTASPSGEKTISVKISGGGLPVGVVCDFTMEATQEDFVTKMFDVLPPPPSPMIVPSPELRSPVIPSPKPTIPQEFGNCTFFSGEAVMDGPVPKPCGRCQWQCLTNMQCTGMEFNDLAFNKTDLATLDCGPLGDAWFTSSIVSPGLCVLFDGAGNVIDAQEQNCTECDLQCAGWSACSSYIYNYEITECPAPGPAAGPAP